MNRLAELISEYIQAHQAEYEAWLSSQGGEENETGGETVNSGGQFPRWITSPKEEEID
nr:MAG TPA: PaaA2 [Caudoviricetes sp.]